MDFSPSTLFAGIVFGLIGLGAWRYGRKQQSARHMLVGAALIGFCYVVPDGWVQWLVGAVLVGLLFFPQVG
ncbi:MAG: hypothetical protein H6741_00370 [Alphaproteobacteria bacterium]|nr:hypothetical protein [Alphaproteobacteria bacterium]MCB9791158.1 hypothetical protein [Alphaproteobacteria bacterium]